MKDEMMDPTLACASEAGGVHTVNWVNISHSSQYVLGCSAEHSIHSLIFLLEQGQITTIMYCK